MNSDVVPIIKLLVIHVKRHKFDMVRGVDVPSSRKQKFSPHSTKPFCIDTTFEFEEELAKLLEGVWLRVQLKRIDRIKIFDTFRLLLEKFLDDQSDRISISIRDEIFHGN
jgi:hypothetical protein